MSETTLSSLEFRKRLLVAESEINRALFQREYEVLVEGVREAAEPLKKLGMLAGSAAAVLGVLKGLSPGNAGPEKPKSGSFFGKLLRMALEGWLGLRRSSD